MLHFDWNARPWLMDLMARQGETLDDIATHARRWVCDPSGFTTSRLSLLAPLAEGLDVVAAGFSGLTACFDQQWSRTSGDVAATLAAYSATDESVRRRLSVLEGRAA